MQIRTAATAFVVLLALAGCDLLGKSSEPTVLGTQAAAGPLPLVGECRDMPAEQVVDPDHWFDESPQVRCSAEHTTETVGVWELSVPRVQQAEQYAGLCSARASVYLDYRRTDHPSVVGIALYLPSRDQAAIGDSWVRCDVFTIADTGNTAATVRTGSLRGAIGADPVAFWPCAHGVPSVQEPQPLVSCKRPHLAEATSTPLVLVGLSGYPSVRRLARAGRRQCASGLAHREDGPRLAVHPMWDPEERMSEGGELRGGCWVSRRDGGLLEPLR